MNINMIAGALVWLFLGVPLAGFALWVLTAPFRAARNATRRRQAARPRPANPLDDIKLPRR